MVVFSGAMSCRSSRFLGNRAGISNQVQTWRATNVSRGRRTCVRVQDVFVLVPIGDGDTEHLDGGNYPQPRTITLGGGKSTIGREAPADVLIPIPTVSGKHATLSVGERVSIKDLDSTNGTFVDGKEIIAGEEELLPLGSEVIFGDSHLAKYVLDYTEEES